MLGHQDRKKRYSRREFLGIGLVVSLTALFGQAGIALFEFFEEQDHGDVLHLAVYNAFEKIFKREGK